MSILTRNTEAVDAALQAPERGSVASQGLRSGMLQAGAGLTALGGTALDAVGADVAAQGLYAKSADLRARGNAAAPEINSYTQVNNLDTAARYAVGLGAQSLPVLGAGLAGAVATRGRSPLLGATAATTPFTAGDLAVRQQEDPTIAAMPAGQRLAQSIGAGGANALLSNVVPVALGGKLLGRGIGAAPMTAGRNVATNVGEAVVGNAAAGALGEKINQTSLSNLNDQRDTSGDNQALMEAGVGGAVVGAPFAAAGIAGQARYGAKPAPRTDGVPVDGGATPPPKTTLVDRFKNAFKKDEATVERETAETIANDGDIIDVEALRLAGPEQQADMLSRADNDRVSKVTDWAKKMAEDVNLSPEARAAVDDFMANPADRTKQAAVAGMKMASDAAATVATKAKEFGDFASKKFDELSKTDVPKDSPIDVGGSKVKGFYDAMTAKYQDATKGKNLSDEFSPKLHSAMADAIAPALSERFPALVQNDKHMQVVTGSLRKVMAIMQATGKLDGDTVEQLYGWFGDDAPSVMAGLHSSVLDGADAAATEKYFGALNSMTDELATSRGLEDQIKAALPEGSDVSPAQMRELIEGVRGEMDGINAKGKPKAQAEFDERQFNDTFRAQFGDKADGLLKAFEKDAKRRFEATKAEREAAGVEEDMSDLSERSIADESEVQYLGGGKNRAEPQLVRSPAAHRAEFNNKSAAERLIEQAQADNPDRMVSFVKVKDLPDDMRAKYPDAGPDDGLVLVEGTRDETRLTPDEIKKITIDTHGKTSHAANNASRIDTGVRGGVIDARALVKTMKRKLDYTSSDDHGNRNRTARAFMEGVAALQDSMGVKFDIPDSVVLEPGFTYGDAKKLTMRKPDPAWMKGKTDEEINKTLQREEALGELNDRELTKAVDTTAEVLEKREAAFSERVRSMRESGVRLTKESYRELRKEMGVDTAKDALRAAEREVAKRDKAARRTQALEDEGRTEVDPNEAITRVGDSEPRTVGLDDNALAYDNFVNAGNAKPVIRAGIESKISRLENMKMGDTQRKNMIAVRVAEKARALLTVMDQMKEVDQALMATLVKDKSVASIAEVVNELHAKYADKIAPPKGFGTDRATLNALDKINAAVREASGNGKRTARDLQRKYELLRERYDKAGKSVESFTRALAAELNVPASVVEPMNALYGGAAPKKPSAFVERVLGKGDLAPVLKSIKESSDPVAVQRAVDALKDVDSPRAREVLGAANERLMTLVEDNPDVAYSMQRTDPNVTSTSKVLADVKAHIDKVLGKSVDTEFKKMLHAGEFVRDTARSAAGLSEDVIRVSVHALDPMGTAMHESMHALFAKLRDRGLMEDASPLMRAADSLEVKAQLRKLLANDPAALKQLDSLEERAAYMYQFWAAGKLQLGAKPAGVLGKLKALLFKVMGMWTNDERAVHIMEYFQSGEFGKNMGNKSAVRDALRAGTNERVESLKQLAKPLSKLADAVFATGNGRLRGTMIPALMELADKVYAPLQGESDDPGYVPAARIKQDQTMNALAESLSGFKEATIADAMKSLQQGVKGASPEERLAMRAVRKTLDDMFAYMSEAGVKINDLGFGKDYFPRVWDTDLILKNEKAFRDMMDRYKAKGDWSGNTDQLLATLTRTDGSELQIETVKPGMVNTKQRKLAFISALDAEPFLQKNLFHTMNSYVTQATRRAEWARRFNDDGSELHAMLDRARREGATQEDLQLASDYLEGVDGTLGDHINPKLRRAFGSMIVYQNLRVLPLMIFSSLIDPMGIAVRGGTAGQAFSALKRGLKEIPKGFKKDAVHDSWTELAATMGVIENSVLMRTVGSSYAQGMSGGTGRKINDAFFKYNLMAQYNTSMRVGATEAAVSFLGRHADGKNSAHSTRWLAELGLKPGDVVVKNGRPLLTRAEFEAHGMKPDAAQDAADRMTLAVNKWVDGAVLRPNAAHKPIWMNDPHYALISHLKQFVYAFQETILKRVINEARYGNVAPAYALAAYVPFMLAADLMKGMVVGGGSQPDYKDGWEMGDYVGSAMQRAGLFGVGQIGLDVATDLKRGGSGIGAVAGPALEQLGDAVQTVAGPKQFETFAMDALPANQLFDAAGEALETPKR